eukprot:scaffold32705_cov76-Cyclotella_meneghiniana.AAC.4
MLSASIYTASISVIGINPHCINQCHWQLLSSSSSELSAPASASINTTSISVIDSYYPEHEHHLLLSSMNHVHCCSFINPFCYLHADQ